MKINTNNNKESVFTEIKKCRICESNKMVEVIKIENQFLSPIFVKENKGYLSEIKVPHTLVMCEECDLLQLKETVLPDLLYKSYFYRSATSDTMRGELRDVVREVETYVNLESGDCVLDIGANDCTMLSYYSPELRRFAIEPAENIDWSHVDKNIKIVNNYFNDDSVKECELPKKVKVFTSCAMFYDLDDPTSFVRTVKDNLHEEGVFCIQLSYLPAMLKNLNFYDICNEHLEYYSLATLNNLMMRHDLEVFDVSENDVNGGSIRVLITHKHREIEKSNNFLNLLEREEKMKLDDANTYRQFYEEVLKIKDKVRKAIFEMLGTGPVFGLGASTKGNMLLQMFELDKKIIPFISERNPDKVGLRTLGTDIELISEEEAILKKPSMMLVLPWYFKNEIVKREKQYLENGGKLLIPMPYPHVVSRDGEEIL